MKFLISTFLLLPLLCFAEVPASDPDLDALNDEQTKIFAKEGATVLGTAITTTATGLVYSRVNTLGVKIEEAKARKRIKERYSIGTKSTVRQLERLNIKRKRFSAAGSIGLALIAGELFILGGTVADHIKIRNQMHDIIESNPDLLDVNDIQENLTDLAKPVVNLTDENQEE